MAVKQKRHTRQADGFYHIEGKKYKELVGSRAEVMHGTAYKTSHDKPKTQKHKHGALLKKHLKYNKHGRIVSVAKSSKGKKLLKRLTSKGYIAKKGKFGVFTRKNNAKGKKKTMKKHHKRRGILLHERRGKHGRFRKL